MARKMNLENRINKMKSGNEKVDIIGENILRQIREKNISFQSEEEYVNSEGDTCFDFYGETKNGAGVKVSRRVHGGGKNARYFMIIEGEQEQISLAAAWARYAWKWIDKQNKNVTEDVRVSEEALEDVMKVL